MGVNLQTITQDVTAACAQEMEDMSRVQYDDYMRNHLVQKMSLRNQIISTPAGYTLATSREQTEMLIKYLQELSEIMN